MNNSDIQRHATPVDHWTQLAVRIDALRAQFLVQRTGGAAAAWRRPSGPGPSVFGGEAAMSLDELEWRPHWQLAAVFPYLGAAVYDGLTGPVPDDADAHCLIRSHWLEYKRVAGLLERECDAGVAPLLRWAAACLPFGAVRHRRHHGADAFPVCHGRICPHCYARRIAPAVRAVLRMGPMVRVLLLEKDLAGPGEPIDPVSARRTFDDHREAMLSSACPVVVQRLQYGGGVLRTRAVACGLRDR